MDPDQISMFDAGRSNSGFTYSLCCGVEHVVRLSLLRQVGGTRPNGARSHVFPQNVQLATKNGILILNLIHGVVGLEDSIHPLRYSTPKRKSIANKMLKATE